MVAASQRLGSRRTTRTATGRIELFLISAIRLDSRSQNSPVTINWCQNRRACSVAKQYARLTISVIDILRQDLGPNHEGITRLASLDHRIGQRQTIQEP